MSIQLLPVYRIMLANLSAADTDRIAAFVRIGSNRLRARWEIVRRGPLQVYVHDADDLPTIPGSVDHPPWCVRLTSSSAEPDSDQLLQRPIQFEAWVTALAAAEADIAHGARYAIPRSADSAPSMGRDIVDTRALLATHAGSHFKLNRWPSPPQLQGARYGHRLAAFLASRYLSAEELAELSGVPIVECLSFMRMLGESGLLLRQPRPMAAGPSRVSDRSLSESAKPAIEAVSAVQPSRALLTSLREKLGIRRT